MKTQELIKQAEKLLKVHDTAFTNERDMVIIATFSRNHMQEIVDRLKKYDGALVKLRDCDWVITLPDRMDGVRAIARKALEEE